MNSPPNNTADSPNTRFHSRLVHQNSSTSQTGNVEPHHDSTNGVGSTRTSEPAPRSTFFEDGPPRSVSSSTTRSSRTIPSYKRSFEEASSQAASSSDSAVDHERNIFSPFEIDSTSSSLARFQPYSTTRHGTRHCVTESGRRESSSRGRLTAGESGRSTGVESDRASLVTNGGIVDRSKRRRPLSTLLTTSTAPDRLREPTTSTSTNSVLSLPLNLPAGTSRYPIPSPGMSASLEPTSAPSSQFARSQLPSSSSSSTTSSTSPTTLFRRATSTSYQLAAPALLLPHDVFLSSATTSRSSPPSNFRRDESYHRYRSSEVDRRGREILEEAEEILSKAEETLRRAAPLRRGPMEGEGDDEEVSNGPPSTRHVLDVDRAAALNAVEARLGESRGNRRSVTAATNRDNTTNVDSFTRSTATSSTRSRLDRNFTSVTHPVVVIEAPPASTSTNPRSASLASSTTSAVAPVQAFGSVGTDDWDDVEEIRSAQRLNERLLARRRNLIHWSESTSAPPSVDTDPVTLWGSLPDRPTSLFSSASAAIALPPSSNRWNTNLARLPAGTTTPVAATGTTTPPPVFSPLLAPSYSHDPSGSTEVSPFATRTSPSLGLEGYNEPLRTMRSTRRNAGEVEDLTEEERNVLRERGLRVIMNMVTERRSAATSATSTLNSTSILANDALTRAQARLDSSQIEADALFTGNHHVNRNAVELPSLASSTPATSITASRRAFAMPLIQPGSNSFSDRNGTQLVFPHPTEASGSNMGVNEHGGRSRRRDIRANRHGEDLETMRRNEGSSNLDRYLERPLAFASTSTSTHPPQTNRSTATPQSYTESSVTTRRSTALADALARASRAHSTRTTSTSTASVVITPSELTSASRFDDLTSLRQEREALRVMVGSLNSAEGLEIGGSTSALARLRARGRGNGMSEGFMRTAMFDDNQDNEAGNGAERDWAARRIVQASRERDVRVDRTRDTMRRYFDGTTPVALDPRNYLPDESFDTSYESLLRLSERLGDVKSRKTGIESTTLSSLRRFVYSAWPHVPRPIKHRTGIASTSAVKLENDTAQGAERLAIKGIEKEERCAVCLADYESDDACMLGMCGHGFHEECLTAWLKEKGTCPVCRSDHSSSASCP